MKAILKFDLDDQDDVMAHYRCIKALDMAMVLWQLKANNKNIETIEQLWAKIDGLLEEYGVNPDELTD